jgi:hypothetical protein
VETGRARRSSEALDAAENLTRRREDDWGPITAAVMFFIILAGLIVYGSGAHLIDRYARGSSGRPDGCIERGASRLRLSDSHGEARAWGHSISASGARC